MLRAIVVGGGTVSEGTLDSCPQALASYGLTESCSMATLVPPGASERVRRSAGHPLPGIDVRIAAGGRIEIRGEVVMRGYLDDPEGTREALRDGWLRTGDIGEIDEDGSLRVLARREDLIVSGGENVYPAEIEAVLRAHPDVIDAVVIGLPDPEWGEVPLALVVQRSPETTDILSFLRKRLAGFKIPRVVPVEAIPLLPNGKPDRVSIRSRYVSPTLPPPP
jgi:O-succinylbenzoic acid--CoA ligase